MDRRSVCQLCRVLILCALATIATWGCARDRPLRASPAALGFVPDTNVGLDVLLDQAVEDGVMPGAVLSVARNGRVLYERAVGVRDPLAKRHAAMTRATLFDVASLTKPAATAPAAALLISQGRLSLSDSVGSANVGALLLHTAGYEPYIDWRELEVLGRGISPGEAIQRAATHDVRSAGEFAYSNLGYVVLAGAIEEVAGESLESFLRREIWGPLGMTRTTFRPPIPTTKNRVAIARTSDDQESGRPFDPLADYILNVHEGHCPGHSGLFATAEDLTIFCQALLVPRAFDVEHLSSVSRLLLDNPVDLTARPLEEDVRISSATPRRTLGFSVDPRVPGDAALIHTGYTGTVIWLNRETGVSVVLLTNAVYTGDERWQSLMSEIVALVHRNTL